MKSDMLYCETESSDLQARFPPAGFGVDSIIESFSGAILLWRLQRHKADEKREQRALKLVGISFFVLAAYVAVDAVKTLIQREPPHASIVGMCLAAVSIVIMPLLARAKRGLHKNAVLPLTRSGSLEGIFYSVGSVANSFSASTISIRPRVS
jgi:hypothetical protein